jgi:hypothetical protein
VKLSEIKIGEYYAVRATGFLEGRRVRVVAVGVPYPGGKYAHGVVVESELDSGRYEATFHYSRLCAQWDEWELRRAIEKHEAQSWLRAFEASGPPGSEGRRQFVERLNQQWRVRKEGQA